jgi:soluble lytic murein transglycosylase-like protein
MIPAGFRRTVEDSARREGIPPHILAALLQHESSWNPRARGAAGEVGIAQILPSTAAQPGYGLRPISLEAAADPNQAIPWAASYLARRGRAAGADWSTPEGVQKALAAYNGAGPQARQYARTVSGLANQLQGLAGSQPAPQNNEQAVAPPLASPVGRPAIVRDIIRDEDVQARRQQEALPLLLAGLSMFGRR